MKKKELFSLLLGLPSFGKHKVNVLRVWIRENYPKEHAKIELQIGANYSNEQLYKFLNASAIVGCKNCGQPTKYLSFSRGMREYCSTRCQRRDPEAEAARLKTREERYGGPGVPLLSEKHKKFWASADPAWIATRSQKTRKTNQQRYGVDSPAQNVEVKARAKRTRESNLNWREESTTKRKQTVLEKYGVDNVMQLDEVKDKLKAINLETLGVAYPMQSGEVKGKAKKTLQNNYGVDNPSQSSVIRKQMEQTSIKKYGVPYHLQNAESLERTYEKQHRLKKVVYQGVEFSLMGYEGYALPIFVERWKWPIEVVSTRDRISIKYHDPINDRDRYYIVDFLIRFADKTIPVEIKSDHTLGIRDLEDHNQKVTRKIVASKIRATVEQYGYALLLVIKPTDPEIITHFIWATSENPNLKVYKYAGKNKQRLNTLMETLPG